MYYKHLLLLLITAAMFSCKKYQGQYDSIPPPQPISMSPVAPVPTVQLKDVILDHLPSPYYHFEYNSSGNVSFVSFASDLTRYDIQYDGNRIIEMRNNILVNKDRLHYLYDFAGRALGINYADSNGIVYTRVNLKYDESSKLIKLERQRKSGADFVTSKTMIISYYPDGNLMDLTVHYPALAWQPESAYTDHYEQYDNKLSIENFSLLHDEFFDHFVFLPGVQIQKNNPGKVTRTNNFNNYQVTYTYAYGDHGEPLTKSGDLVFTSGPNIGQRFQLSSVYTYY